MPKYNIYRLLPDKKEILIDKLKKTGLVPQTEKESNGYKLQLYFSKEPDEKDVPWIKLYEDFIDSANDIRNKTYFAVLLISKNKDILYGVSLGKSHFYLQEFCDLDFGINIGLRIIDKNYVHNKNSRLFGGKRKKNLIIYKSDTEIDIESGESVVYLKGRTIDTTKERKQWGKNLICGTSALFSIKDYQPNSLPILISSIEEKLKDEPLFNIPRAEAITKVEKIKELDQKLISLLKNKDEVMEIDEQNISGVEFIFSKDYNFSLKSGDSDWYSFEDQTVASLFKIINEHHFDLSPETIDQLKIKATPDEGFPFVKNIRYFLDYVDDEHYFLHSGKWFKLNQRYVDYLYSETDKIAFEEDNSLTFNESEYKKYIEKIDDRDKNKWYAEKYFNEIVASNNGYKNLDRVLIKFDSYKLEVADLYKSNTIFFVKIGNLQKQNYVLQQCLGTLKYLIDNNNKIIINNEQNEINNICLWLILSRKNKIKELKNLKSFLFLMGLVDCCREVRLAGLKPIIKISYKGTNDE